MATILVTGASGFLGSRLVKALSLSHQVVTIGRNASSSEEGVIHYRGNFAEFEDLRQLDQHDIDGVVHLAAVTGGCLEREGMLVNVEGTRCLMRYLVDRGCRKFVNASSIAVVGIQSTAFRPLFFPMTEEHPCLDRDGYGVSKYLMEEVTHYLARQNPQIDVINLRLAAIHDSTKPPSKVTTGPLSEWGVGHITQLSDIQAVEVLTRAVEAKYQPGVRIINAVSKDSWVEGTTIEVLKRWWGESVDLGYFEKNENPKASLYCCKRLAEELGCSF